MADIQPALSHDHPLYYDAASTVREDSDKLLAKLRRAHALSERYCNLGAKMAAVSSELASELVGAASLCESEGLRSALGVLASEAEVEATLPPKQQLAVIANALTRTAQASEMLAAQLRAIVSEPLRELIEDPEGPAAIAAKHAELTAASHAMHESLLDTLRPGVGAGSRPRASDLSKGAASATFAAKGAARGMGGMFSKLMERAGQGNVSMLASVASQIDESLGITGAEPSSGAAGNASRQGLPAPAPEVLPRRQASRAGGASATADEDAPPPTAEERLVEGQLAFAAARLEFELRAREVSACLPSPMTSPRALASSSAQRAPASGAHATASPHARRAPRAARAGRAPRARLDRGAGARPLLCAPDVCAPGGRCAGWC